MRIRSVTAHAFGPLCGETLELAEGMTVVVGDNESGKSSWHAAIYAAVCGRRRGRGRSRLDEQRFADLHRPWDSDGWLVSGQIDLDDGRRIEMRHDLAGRVDYSAKDLTLGADVSAEVMWDGAPDGSRWLGLDRESFAATACVEQAHLLRVLEDADGLQQHLQRAAATAGTDATAAAALDRLDEFSREHVGLERANSTRPLQRALNAVARTEEQLRVRREAHDAYLSRVEEVEVLRSKAAAAAAELGAHEAAVAQATAAKLHADAQRAAELHAAYGDAAPISHAEEDALAQQVSAALAAWQLRPEPAAAPERSSSQIRAELEMLPEAPTGDLAPHPSVLTAVDELTRAGARLDQHGRSRPQVGVHSPTIAAEDAELLDLARVLELPTNPLPPAAGRHNASRTRGRSGGVMIAAALILALAGAALVAVNVILGVVVVAAGVVLAVAGLLRRGSVRDVREMRAADAAAQRQRALARSAELGVNADPATLRAVPVARAHAAAEAAQLAQWEEQELQLRSGASDARAELAAALAARGVSPTSSDRDSLLAAAERYHEDCRRRGEQGVAAGRREDLLAQLSAVQDVEQRLVRDARERAQAAEDLLTAVRASGGVAETPEQAATALTDWLERHSAQVEEASAAERDWAELRALLAGRTITELQRAAAAAQDRARQLADGVDPVAVAAVDVTTAAESLSALRNSAAEAETAAASAEGALSQFATTIGSVAEAEEAAEQAADELVRVRELADTLALTRSFLAAAQDRVHRDIAPVLAATVKRDLPRLTDGRYIDVIVNPTTLNVQVCGSSRRWRDAGRLSYGTTEQVYLLLRIALADHLTRGHDTCPLLFDDVTVHADGPRTYKILDMLLEVADRRQVVLFTQEEQVAAWAREHLHEPRHAIRQLATVPVT